MRVLGITATMPDGTPVGERQELRTLDMNVVEPIATVRSERALQALITRLTGYNQKERKRLNIKADVTAS